MSAARLRAPLDMQGNEEELLRDFAAPGDASLAFTFNCETILVRPESCQQHCCSRRLACVTGVEFLLKTQ